MSPGLLTRRLLLRCMSLLLARLGSSRWCSILVRNRSVNRRAADVFARTIRGTRPTTLRARGEARPRRVRA